MKKKFIYFIFACLLFSLSACGKGTENNYISISEEASGATEEAEMQTEEDAALNTESKEEDMSHIEILVGDKVFTATVYNNETARAFTKQLPMTIQMNELNGNEKYYYLGNQLPVNEEKPATGIHTGDIMLYDTNCLVLFYDSFPTSYRYTPIGVVDSPDELAEALGNDSVQVTIQSSEKNE